MVKTSLINKFPSNLGLQNTWLIINCLPTWSISCTKAWYNWWQRPWDICFPLTGHPRYPMNVFSHSTDITAKLAIAALSNKQREYSLEQCMHHVRMHMISFTLVFYDYFHHYIVKGTTNSCQITKMMTVESFSRIF